MPCCLAYCNSLCGEQHNARHAWYIVLCRYVVPCEVADWQAVPRQPSRQAATKCSLNSTEACANAFSKWPLLLYLIIQNSVNSNLMAFYHVEAHRVLSVGAALHCFTAIWGSSGVAHPPVLCFVIARSLDVIGGTKYVLDGWGKAEFDAFVLFFWICQPFFFFFVKENV